MRPAPRTRRRQIVADSDDDEQDAKGSASRPVELDSLPPTQAFTKLRPSSIKQNATAIAPVDNEKLTLPARSKARKAKPRSSTSSPEKVRINSTKGVKFGPSKSEAAGVKNLFTFFTNSTQAQRTDTQRTRSDGKSSQETHIDLMDTIQDEDFGDAFATTNPSTSSSRAAVSHPTNGKKRSWDSESSLTSGSQKYRKISKPAEVKSVPKLIQDDARTWAEKFGPENLDELVVHKKKVSDVKSWLEAVMSGRDRKRLLVLKGASGTGKTTTISLLAKALDYEILEWRNPNGSTAGSDGLVSMSSQFEDFIGRGRKFGSLDLFSSNVQDTTSTPEQREVIDYSQLDKRKKIILIEEFPNTFSRSSQALQVFRSTILQYLASNIPSLSSMVHVTVSEQSEITPIIMVISETVLTTSTAAADSFTAHRLLGPQLLGHPGVTVIEFNPVATTLMTKALDLIIHKEARQSGRRKIPGPLALKKLGEVGDVRSAIGSLEFLCVRGDDSGDWGGQTGIGKGRKTKHASLHTSRMTKMETETLEMVTQREASLGIFHAVGKVVYNKRAETVSSENELPQPPVHLPHHFRPKKSLVSVEELIDETGTDTQTFVAALHENYILSCTSTDPMAEPEDTMDAVIGCINDLSDSDLLCPSWDGGFGAGGFGGGFGRGAFQGAGSDTLRQDEISFQIAVRGILFALPCPVKRQAPPGNGSGSGGWNRAGAGRSDAFKMFYPASLRLWRKQEETEALVDVFTEKLQRGDCGVPPAGGISDSGATSVRSFVRAKPTGVESWNKSVGMTKETSHQTSAKPSNKEPAQPLPLQFAGATARKEMLLERLPYLTLITRCQTPRSSTLKQLLSITAFRGTISSTDDVPSSGEDSDLQGDEWATDKAVEEGTPKKKQRNAYMKKQEKAGSVFGGLPMPMESAIEKLVLSDDDIEDD